MTQAGRRLGLTTIGRGKMGSEVAKCVTERGVRWSSRVLAAVAICPMPILTGGSLGYAEDTLAQGRSLWRAPQHP